MGRGIALAALVTLGSHGFVRAAPAAPDAEPSPKGEAALLPAPASGPAAEAGRLLRQVMASIAHVSILAGASQHSGPGTMQEVCEGLTCQCGCGLTVANCNHPNCPFAVPLRTEIDGMIKAGMSRTAIIAHFRQKYGEKILSAPTTEGFNILAWIMPFAALLGGAVLILVAVGRWRPARPAPQTSPPESRGGEVDPRLKKLLERELRERF